MWRGEPYSVVVLGLLQRGGEVETATGHSCCLGHVDITRKYVKKKTQIRSSNKRILTQQNRATAAFSRTSSDLTTGTKRAPINEPITLKTK